MKNLFAVLLFPLFVYTQAQTPVFNEYGEVKTKIYRTSSVQAWTSRDLDADRDKLITKVGEGLYNDIYTHSNLNQYPPAINEVKNYWANEQKLTEYNVWFVVDLKGSYCGIVRVSPKDNGHMPNGFLPADGSDFYLLVDHTGIENYNLCYEQRKNTPERYKAYVSSKNLAEEAPSPGSEELNKGLAALNKSEYQTALDFFTESAGKGNAAAMYNLGYMYYNNKLPQQSTSYNSNDVLNSVLNGSKQTEERRQKAFGWYKKAAEAGSTKGMYAVGFLYSQGEGVPQNTGEAKKWLQKAADNGDEEAKKELENLK